MSRIEKLNRELERVYLQGVDLDGNKIGRAHV